MRYFAGLTIVLALGMSLWAADPMPTWTPEQQEVIKAQQACWASWHEGYDAWVQTCRPVEDLVWWFPNQSVATLEDELRDGRKWREGQEQNRYYSISPHAVQIFGDTAVIYYSAAFWNRQWGEEIRGQERRAEVFIRIDGRWCIAGGLVADVE